MMWRLGKMHCSFCGESEHTVARLIAGPRVFICEGCVDKCIGILGSKPNGGMSRSSAWNACEQRPPADRGPQKEARRAPAERGGNKGK
jgi:hypothetical protein